MSEYMAELDARIKRLKADANSRNDWRRARIEIEKHGGRWRADNGTVFELRDGAIYQFMTENGVSNLIISAVDAPIPYIASLDIDAQEARGDELANHGVPFLLALEDIPEALEHLRMAAAFEADESDPRIPQEKRGAIQPGQDLSGRCFRSGGLSETTPSGVSCQ